MVETLDADVTVFFYNPNTEYELRKRDEEGARTIALTLNSNIRCNTMLTSIELVDAMGCFSRSQPR